jgi:aspartyl protease family protein
MGRAGQGVVLCGCAGAFCISVALASDAPEAVLKTKGLQRSGSTYVIKEEMDVQKKVKDAGKLYKQLSYAVMQQHAFTQGSANRKAVIHELTQERIFLSQQLRQVGSVAENNRVVAALSEVTDRLNLLREEDANPEVRERIQSQVPQQREAYVQAVLDLRQAVDAANAKYANLAADSDVKSALNELNKKSKTKFALGPSRSYLANVKLLEKTEASVLSETVELRKDSGVFWVDVTFNGKVTKPMIFDTGASLTTLPASMAAQIGLRPSPSDQTIHCQIADGSVVEAKQMTVESMRVGKFTVKDIKCAVMPANKQDVPPLLGGSFHRLFTYKFSPESGKLVLTTVETPEETKPASRSASKKASRGAKGKGNR